MAATHSDEFKRDAITKHLNAGTIETQFTTSDRQSKLDPFAEKPTGWLKAEACKSRKQRRTLKRLHTDLVVLGFSGSYNRGSGQAQFICCRIDGSSV